MNNELCEVCTLRLAGNYRSIASTRNPSASCSLCSGLFSSIQDKIDEAVALSGFQDVHEIVLCVKVDAVLTLQGILESRLVRSSRIPVLNSSDPILEIRVTELKDAVKLIYKPKLDTNLTDTKYLPPLRVDLEISSPNHAFLANTVKRFRSVKEASEEIQKLSDRELAVRVGHRKFDDPLEDLHAALFASSPITTSIRCERESVFLLGKYKKSARDIAQSKWFVDSDFVVKSSVEEVAEEWLRREFFDATISRKSSLSPTTATLSSSGREDVDVRMLGNGRDFCMEISNPQTLARIAGRHTIGSIERFVSPLGVEISDMRLVDRRVLPWLHHCSESHSKSYTCVVWCEKSIDNVRELSKVKNLEICQWTPVRTLHRRANLARSKTLFGIKAELVGSSMDGSHFLQLTLSTSAGMYIKEFVHSDFGRTSPSLADLLGCPGARCDILQLDVLEVEDVEYPF